MENGMDEGDMVAGGHTQVLVRQEFQGVGPREGALLPHRTHPPLRQENRLKSGTFFLPCQIKT